MNAMKNRLLWDLAAIPFDLAANTASESVSAGALALMFVEAQVVEIDPSSGGLPAKQFVKHALKRSTQLRGP